MLTNLDFNNMRSKAFSDSAYTSPHDHPSSQSSLQAPVVQMAREHISSVFKTSNLLPRARIDLLKTDYGNLTASGRIRGFSSLTVWLEE